MLFPRQNFRAKHFMNEFGLHTLQLASGFLPGVLTPLKGAPNLSYSWEKITESCHFIRAHPPYPPKGKGFQRTQFQQSSTRYFQTAMECTVCMHLCVSVCELACVGRSCSVHGHDGERTYTDFFPKFPITCHYLYIFFFRRMTLMASLRCS